MNSNSLEILKFTPILKGRIWGGDKLNRLLGKEYTGTTTGESWEISDVEGYTSVVSEGLHKGKTLKELLETYKQELVGKKNYERFGSKFPLLIKFIDARENLSIQLHPNDQMAKQRHNSFGKTEMWYVMQADTNANIIIGFNQKVTPIQYQEHVANNTIVDILHKQLVTKGDTFLVYAGLIHAIGKGVLLAEIQQTSDVTYRIYDWDRTDKEGNSRELHQQEALEALDYQYKTDHKIAYNVEKNESTELVSCPYFTTSLLEIDKQITIYPKNNDSFSILMCVAGEALITYGDMEQGISITMGETVLIPASTEKVNINAKKAKLLEVHI